MPNNINPEVFWEIGDHYPDGLAMYSFEEQRIVYVNHHAQALGVKPDASLPELEDLLDRVIPRDREFVKNQFSQLLSTTFTGEFEFAFLAADEMQVYLNCSAVLVSDDSMIAVFLRNVTTAREHADYLVEFGARKNTVLDTLAHNISGALALTQTFSSQAEKYLDPSTHPNVRKYLGLVRENSAHSLKIIGDVISHEHERSPDVLVKNTRVNLIEIIRHVYEEFVNAYGNRRFLFDAPDDVVVIHCDEVKLLQVVNNYASNAIKFSPAEKPITLRVQEAADAVMVSVHDHGIGIPNHLKPYIFTRSEGKGRTGLNGEISHGLGLWICRNLIELMGGKVWFESTVGKGSDFYLRLPR